MGWSSVSPGASNLKSLNPLARASFVLAALAVIAVGSSQGCIVKGAYDEYCAETGNCPDGGGASDGGHNDGGTDGGFDGGGCLAPTISCGPGTCCTPPNQACNATGGCCAVANQTCTQGGQCCSGTCDVNVQKCTSCLPQGSTCVAGGVNGCCNGFICDNISQKCVLGCGALNADCSQGQACCSPNTCDPVQKKCLGTVTGCMANGNVCSNDQNCCSGACRGGNCAACAASSGDSCDSRGDCCLGGPNVSDLKLRCSDSQVCSTATNTTDAGVCWKSRDYCLPNDICCFGECTAQACPTQPPAACGPVACATASDCCAGQWCDLTGTGFCMTSAGGLKPQNIACRHHKECQSNYCDTNQPPGKWRCAQAQPVGCAALGSTCSTPGNCCNGGLGCFNNQCCTLPGEPCGDLPLDQSHLPA